jgi:hypothetical protein
MSPSFHVETIKNYRLSLFHGYRSEILFRCIFVFFQYIAESLFDELVKCLPLSDPISKFK